MIEELEFIKKWIVLNDNAFAGISLYIDCVIKEGPIACTDGKKVYISPKFFTEFKDKKERTAVIVHEMLHIALRHVQRSKDKNKQLWNYATDCVINLAISNIEWAKLPKDCIRIEHIIDSKDLSKIRAEDWNADNIYNYLLQKEEKYENKFNPKDRLGKDLKEGEEGSLEDIIWRERVKRVVSNDRSGGILRSIEKEIESSKINWQKVLKRYLITACNPEVEETYSRPSRSSLALKNKVFLPAFKRKLGTDKIFVIIDTSGSIDQELLQKFSAEVQDIQEKTNCCIDLIFADAAVQSRSKVKKDGIKFIDKIKQGKIEVKGGGGTDFVPALNLAKKEKARLVVYLTDGYGNFGRDPKLNIIWAINTTVKAPYGKTIKLEI